MSIFNFHFEQDTNFDSAMYNVLLILLHRPFVSEGHLHSMSPSIASNSFSACSQAATKIVQLLRVYQKTFSIRHAPYLIAYATYVASTIHVRIAAQLGPGSEAYNSLRTCCSVFAKNQDTNWVEFHDSEILDFMADIIPLRLQGGLKQL